MVVNRQAKSQSVNYRQTGRQADSHSVSQSITGRQEGWKASRQVRGDRQAGKKDGQALLAVSPFDLISWPGKCQATIDGRRGGSVSRGRMAGCMDEYLLSRLMNI